MLLSQLSLARLFSTGVATQSAGQSITTRVLTVAVGREHAVCPSATAIPSPCFGRGEAQFSNSKLILS